MPAHRAHRPLALLLAAILALSLAACTGSGDETPTPTVTATATPAETASPAPMPPTATPSPTAPPTTEPTATPAPSPTPTATATPTPIAAPTLTATATPTRTPTATATPEPAESPTTFRYHAYDTSGGVAEPGSYAFLADPADASSAVTTYEALRDGSARGLRIHETDADGVSRAAFLDSVEVGDTFEWRYADDCWIGYRVTGVMGGAAGNEPRRQLAVRPYGYAYTGCKGALAQIAANAAVKAEWREPLVRGGDTLAYPVVYGPYQVVPDGWTGELDYGWWVDPPAYSFDLGAIETRDVEEARKLPFWRDLPGWTLSVATSGYEDGPLYGYCAILHRGVGDERDSVDVCGGFATRRGAPSPALLANGGVVEVRTINDYAAAVSYYPGPQTSRIAPITVLVYDEATQAAYELSSRSYSLSGTNVEALLVVARTLFPAGSATITVEDDDPLPPQTTFRYDTYDTTGAVAEPGSYAFLADPADTSSAVTTYEGLRDGTATALRIHATDADGVSRAAFLDTVEVGDTFEWRYADDCWIGYRVTGVMGGAAGNEPRRQLAVRPYGYAYTGCKGALAQIAANAAVKAEWREPLVRGGDTLAYPVVYGTFQVVPVGWAGELDYGWGYDPPAYSLDSPVETRSLSEARKLPYWRDLPGWTLRVATSGAEDGPLYGYCATFDRGDGEARDAVDVCGAFASRRGAPSASSNPYGRVVEVRVINGYSALVSHIPSRPTAHRLDPITVVIYDEASQSVYEISGRTYSLRGRNLEAVLAVVRTLFPAGSATITVEDDDPLPPQTTFRYDAYDTSGAVGEPGSYAFLADPADASSAVTTYEGLRDGTATALRIHATDADGVSRAVFLDSVEVGDLFEWKEADDCFVRYAVTEVLAEPSGPPRRLLGVEWMTYAFTGCSGPIAAEAAATVDWGELPDLGGTSLTVPIVHGIYQIVPAGWKGATVEEKVDFDAPGEPHRGQEPRWYSTLAEARQLPYWRDPALPEGWKFDSAGIGGLGPHYGYCARFITEERTWRHNEVYRNPGFDLCGEHVVGWYHAEKASWHDGASVRETRVIAGRPAMVIYSPEGPNSSPGFPITIWVYDAGTESTYTLVAADRSISGSNIEAALVIVRGLFEPPNPP